MTDAPDVFAAFVAILAEALDEHDATGADLARRVHLSRYHFDRVIHALSGEPPGRFRRRVLLERAAYRLLTSDRIVLDIAVEAGYSSQEAFTRAFARAYGTTPARWRRKPGVLRIDAPNSVHFHPPASLRLPASRRVSSMDLILGMLEHHRWLLDQMLQRAGALDDAQLDRPVEVSVEGIDQDRTLRSLLARLVGQLEMWNAAIAGAEYDLEGERTRTVPELRARLAVVGSAFQAHIADALEHDRLDEALVCPGETVEVYTIGAVVAHVLTYAAHRRTLVAGALWDAGVRGLDDDPVRWLTQASASGVGRPAHETALERGVDK